MSAAWRVTIRSGPKVRRSEHETLGEAIAALEQGCRTAPRRDAVDLRMKTFEPVQQIALRAEVKGPRGTRGGVDVRGDGSAEAYVGRIRRRLVEPGDGEDVYAALRRALATPSSVSVEP